MATLDELQHPITPAQTRARHDSRKPLHVPGDAGDRAITAEQPGVPKRA